MSGTKKKQFWAIYNGGRSLQQEMSKFMKTFPFCFSKMTAQIGRNWQNLAKIITPSLPRTGGVFVSYQEEKLHLQN